MCVFRAASAIFWSEGEFDMSVLMAISTSAFLAGLATVGCTRVHEGSTQSAPMPRMCLILRKQRTILEDARIGVDVDVEVGRRVFVASFCGIAGTVFCNAGV